MMEARNARVMAFPPLRPCAACRHDGSGAGPAATHLCVTQPFRRRASLREGRAKRRCLGGRRWRDFAAIKSLDQIGEHSPEERVARIAVDAANLAAVIDQHEHGCEALARDEGEFGGNPLRDVEAAQWRALAFGGLVVCGSNVAVETPAPHAALLLEHYQFGRMRR